MKGLLAELKNNRRQGKILSSCIAPANVSCEQVRRTNRMREQAHDTGAAAAPAAAGHTRAVKWAENELCENLAAL